MNEIYWITRLDMINIWLIIFSVISGVIMVVSTILYIVDNIYDLYFTIPNT